MFATILRDPDAAKKLLDTIADSPSGRRSISRLARTCKAICEPALDVLWRELDSLLPLIALFPNNLLKRTRRPGLGLVKVPSAQDWDRLLEYGKRVRRITYSEMSSAAISPTVFATINDHSPVPYILPNLQQLVWKVENTAALESSILFMNPELQSLVLEIGHRVPKLDAYLSKVCSLTQLTAFSFTSPTTLPQNFTDLLRSQNTLEKLCLVAPGALSCQIGHWAASLPALHSLELDLTGRSVTAVEGFFDDIIPSGANTPSDTTSNSSILSGDEIDFTEIRKSSLRLTGDLRTWRNLQHVALTGETSNIAVFLKHITSQLIYLELVIEDPPEMTDWQDLSFIICDRFGHSLRSLRITATGSSRFSELVRSTSRAGDPTSRHLPLQYLTSLPCLVRLEIDLPESTIFRDKDLQCLSKACPNLEMLKLCPMARFSATTGPGLSLEGVSVLTMNCRRLHTLWLVIDAHRETLASLEVTSRSLLRLHVGHSAISDPLHTTILLSHLAPHLEILKWFHEKNRPGFVEAHALGWQRVSDWLPHLQDVRLMERARVAATKKPKVVTKDQSVDATDKRTYVNKFAHVRPKTSERAIQSTPSLVDRMTQVKPDLLSVFVDAYTTMRRDTVCHKSVGVEPMKADAGVDATPPTAKHDDDIRHDEKSSLFFHRYDFHAIPSAFPTVFAGLLAFTCRIFFTYPLAIPKHVLDSHELQDSSSCSTTTELLDHDIPPGYFHEYYYNADWNGKQWTDEPQLQPTECNEDEVRRGGDSTQGHSQEGSSRLKPDRPYSRLHYSQVMAEVKKQERDFSPELGKAGKLPEALGEVTLCYEARDYTQLNATVHLLSKKHGQLKGVIQAFVEQAIGWLPEIRRREGDQIWLELVETLRAVTEGKIFLETPRARVTLVLSQYHEALAKQPTASPSSTKESLQTATDLLSDLQVETYSSMERREKTEFILEQIRLLIALARLKDDEVAKTTEKEGKIGLGVGGRKVNETFLKEKENELALHRSAYLDVAKHYEKVWDTPSIKEDEGQKSSSQACSTICLVNPALEKLELH
ncbi:hypothetical protein BKA83DRAFT_393571 [Pisolithus microcarpus]|nr:hypothetical protein BKA83DRAFT_393571 [Pisolithus microcarpus]